ncbi:MAG TPA: c-type cytochrome [Bryobacteraceae bacterium]|nr:c-type cytochrome [Bryobacteraceae bacterium]
MRGLITLRAICAAAVLCASSSLWAAQAPNAKANTPSQTKASPQSETEATIKSGQTLFLQDCAFCHGRDAGGGESGPDLTSSTLVATDLNGNKIAPVVRQGRPNKGMPPFNLSAADIAALVAFIHDQKSKSDAHPGGRRRVDVADLQSGNAEAGKEYFNGAGGCTSCHSVTGDLAGVAKRYTGLRLEERLLYPRDAKAKVTVTLPSGQTLAGTLQYRDEFTIGMTDQDGWYHSWPVNAIKYKVDEPAEAHAELLGKYTDDDIHNLMAYLQALK